MFLANYNDYNAAWNDKKKSVKFLTEIMYEREASKDFRHIKQLHRPAGEDGQVKTWYLENKDESSKAEVTITPY